MKKYLFFSLLSILLLTCCQNGTNNGTPSGNSNTDPSDNPVPDSLLNRLKVIDAYDYSSPTDENRYVSFRFVTYSVNYVTNPDSSVSLSGSGAIIDLLLVAQAVNDHHFPLAGTYYVGSEDNAFTASNATHFFGNETFTPAIYKVTDGEASAAIRYTSGTVKVQGDNDNCTIILSLGCQDGFTRNYEFIGKINVIDKSQTSTPSSISFRESGPIKLAVGDSHSLHIDFNPSYTTDNIQFSVDNPSVVSIQSNGNTSCQIIGMAKGNCTVTAQCAHSSVSASIQVSVISEMDVISGCEFYQFFYSQLEAKYAIYRLRVLTNYGDDLSRTRVDDNTRQFPNYNEWLYRYSKDDHDYGIFKDSVMMVSSILLSTDAYFDYEGNIASTSSCAPIIWFHVPTMFDSQYWYCLGDFDIVNDPTASDTIRPAGVAAQPMPCMIQSSHFNENIYLNYMTALINEEEPEVEDYPYFMERDAYILPLFPYQDYETGEVSYWLGRLLGTVQDGGYIYLGQDDNQKMYAEAYNINTTLYENPRNSCLKTTTSYDPSTGEPYMDFVQPLEMANSKNVTYSKDSPYETREFAPVRKEAMARRMKVQRTMGAILRIHLLGQRKIWRR